MKQKQEMQKLLGLDKTKLEETLAVARDELFTLRLNASTAHIKDYSKFKVLRRRIARILTMLCSDRFVAVQQ